MTIILRLQGLHEEAGTEDIRIFFHRLHIPDGGVYIAGGSLKEAFIAFTTERDGQLATRYSGKFLKGSKVTLHLSSMEEVENKLKSLLKRKKRSSTQLNSSSSLSSPDAKPQLTNRGHHSAINPNVLPATALACDPRTETHEQCLCTEKSNLQHPETSKKQKLEAFPLEMCVLLQSLQQSNEKESKDPVPSVDFPNTYRDVSNDRTPHQTLGSKPGYIRLFGLPPSATKLDLCHFLKGFTIQDAIVNVQLGLNRGCLVKFASEQEAHDALFLNRKSLDSCLEVRGATEKMWTMAQRERKNTCDVGERVNGEMARREQKPTTFQIKRGSENWLQSKLPKKTTHKDVETASSTVEYTIMIRNLPKTTTKTEIKELLNCPDISNRNVQHLLDISGNRTSTAFVVFNLTEDYDYAMSLTGCHVGSNTIEISSISRMMMRDMMEKTNRRRKFKKTESTQRRTFSVKEDLGCQTCLFVRNMPADVQKSQIRNLFYNFGVKMDNIAVLRDRNGEGTGEAVVEFKSQKLAELAQRIHGQEFMGSTLLLTPINVKQMEKLLALNV